MPLLPPLRRVLLPVWVDDSGGDGDANAAALSNPAAPCAARLPPQVCLHDAVALRITPISPQPSHTDLRPWHGQPLYARHEEDEQWIPRLEEAEAAGLRRDQLPV